MMKSKRKYKILKRKYNRLLDMLVSLSLKFAAAEEQKVVDYVYTYVPNERG